jgi:hypothetical protein
MFFAGLAQGFSDAQEKDRALQAQIDNEQANRDQQTLLHIATTHPDPDTRANALAAMMSPKQPGKGGFFDRMTNSANANPALPHLRQLLGQTQQQPVMGQPPPPPDTAGGQPLERDVAPQQPVQVGTRTALANPPPTSADTAGATAFAQAKGHLTGVLSAAQGTTTDPTMMMYAEAHALGVPITHADDPQGNRTFLMGNQTIGVARGVAKMAAPEQRVHTEAENLAAAAPPGAPLSPDAAVTQARTNEATVAGAKQATAVAGAGTAQSREKIEAANAAQAPEMAAARLAASKTTTLVGQARERFLASQTVAEWQRVNGTTPMNPSQRINAARELLGNDPSVTAADVGRLADTLGQTQGTGAARTGGAAVPPPTAGAASAAPAATTPPGAPKPTAAAAPPGGVSGALSSTGLGATAKNFKAYSEDGKRTVQAVTVLGQLLPKLEQTIRSAGLANDGNALAAGIEKRLYGEGFAQNDTVEQILQRSGMAEGYGLRGLLGGRSNQSLQGIMSMHLVSPGDSPKLILQKIRTLKDTLPDILSAVDKAEGMRVGGGAGQGSKPAASTPPVATHPEGQPGTLNGKPVVWRTIGGQSGWVDASQGAPPAQ